uniref:Chromate transporter n=1 Tax=Anopheles coluzzii TaxID=1518534 RepID=A0A8W7P6D8_ANOCL
LEPGESRQQPVHGQGGGDIDIQPPSLFACGQFFGGTGNAVQCRLNGRQVGLACRRQPHAPAMAFKQLHPQPLLQLLDLAANGTMCHIQCTGGCAEITVAGSGFKGFQCIERRESSIHSRLSGFGGVLPLAHRMLVQQRRWLSEEEFTELLGLGQILPGPNIVNMSIAIGSRFHGVAGAWLAVAGLMLAPLVIVLSMAVLYDHYQSLPDVQGTLRGLASTAAGLLLAMALRMGVKIERHVVAAVFALLTFLAVGVLRWPLLLVLLVLAPVSVLLAHRRGREGEKA